MVGLRASLVADPNEAVGSESRCRNRDGPKLSAGRWDDPSWLAENYFRGRHFVSEDPDTMLLARLMTVRSKPPLAAARLRDRLMATATLPVTVRQARFLKLLGAVASAKPVSTQNCIRRNMKND